MRTLNQDQKNVNPEMALQLLREGNKRFLNNLKINRDYLQQINETRDGQFPFATVLSCIDSRTSAELIFDQGLGDIFSIRIAGNIVNEDILGSMEFACASAGSKLVLVLGHTKCGAIAGACNRVEMGNLTGLLNKVKLAIDREKNFKAERHGANYEFVKRVTELNVQLAINQIREKSPILSGLEAEGKIKICGGLYMIETGEVKFYDGTLSLE